MWHSRTSAPPHRHLKPIVEDLVTAHLLVHGFGPEPVRQMQVERLRRGKIVEHWRVTA